VVTLSLAGLVTQTYFSLRSLDAQIANTRSTLVTRDDAFALVKRRADAGYASDLDLRQAEGARADISAQLKELVRQRALVEHQLGVLTDRLDLAVSPGDLSQLPQPPLPPPGLPSALLERRPDIRFAEQQLVAENALIGVAMAAQLPTISLTGNFGGQSSTLAALVTGPARIWSIGVGLTTPIFDAASSALADASARYKYLPPISKHCDLIS
jgi:multidrug efflux system outer membrane protein